MKPGSLYTLLLALILMISKAALSQTGTPPNVLFIAVDDLRPDLGCYGNRKVITPNMDRLAGKGLVFNRAYCQQAVCNPSRASVLTGLRPDETGVTDLITHFRQKNPDVVTLPQAFKQAGYTAVGIGKIFHGSRNTQDEASWSRPSLENLSVRSDEYFLPPNKKKGKAGASEFTEGEDNKYPDGKITDAVISALREFKSSGEKFFLAAGFKKPHLPFCAPQKYLDLYAQTDFSAIAHRQKPGGAPDIAFHQWQELRGYSDIPDAGPLDGATEATLRRAYYACISYVDAQIGKILDELDRLGLRQQTIIVLWGDHGYHLGEQELWCKSTNFELDDRIPMIISAPPVNAKGAVTNAIVEAVDLYPTLTDLCGIRPSPTLSGKSLVPLLKDPERKWNQKAYSQFCRPYKAIGSGHPTHMGYTVRDEDWRYTVWYRLKDDVIESRELYDMQKDPVETINLAGQAGYKKVEDKLGRLLESYRNKNNKQVLNN
ncbi:sulfatase [Niabella beijingensis]|uniref:sulfatase n=1 Tax=Niabella beijingensis TaxID=2872700 RepID=UPI001CBBA307|nr:sulfatase [Niabella beijingensis]MBZ4192447.1 sulfatase [Niabella beijingensis]